LVVRMLVGAGPASECQSVRGTEVEQRVKYCRWRVHLFSFIAQLLQRFGALLRLAARLRRNRSTRAARPRIWRQASGRCGSSSSSLDAIRRMRSSCTRSRSRIRFTRVATSNGRPTSAVMLERTAAAVYFTCGPAPARAPARRLNGITLTLYDEARPLHLAWCLRRHRRASRLGRVASIAGSGLG